jgi:GT2 family glycosyltransferase
VLAEAFGVDRLPGAKRVLGEYELNRRRYEREAMCEWTTGFLLVRRAALEKDGWFDERFIRAASEADLCLRMTRAGWGVLYTPALTVQRRRLSRWESVLVEAQVAQARMQYARKHFPRAAADYRWAMALRYGLRVALYSLFRRGGSHRQAARAGLATVLRGGIGADAAL